MPLHVHISTEEVEEQSGGRDEMQEGSLREERNKITHVGVILPAVAGVLTLVMAG